jgi:shikimate dehydrogenase
MTKRARSGLAGRRGFAAAASGGQGGRRGALRGMPNRIAPKAPGGPPSRTIRAAVLGADVSKSRSPAIHNAAFRALGLRGAYEAFSVDAAGFDALVADLRTRGFRYVNVTIPHKAAAAALADARGPEVRASGAANTLIFEPASGEPARGARATRSPSKRGRRARVRAENTDGAGLLAALADLGVRPRGARLVVVGAGGAAAGALEALTRAGARVELLARRPEAARALRLRLPVRQRARITVRRLGPTSLARALRGATALVSAVPAAAWDEDTLAGVRELGRETAVLEMAYGAETPLAAAVRPLTPRYADGLGMLVHQAARAFALACDKTPPLPALLRAARTG